MEWAILFAGPPGAGKTQAIRTASDVDVVGTEAAATDDTRSLKEHTTVAMDMGVMRLDGGDRIRLLGAPGQERFDFMWDILLQQARGAVLLVDHSQAGAIEHLRFHAEQLRGRTQNRWLPWVVGVTHMDMVADQDLRPYRGVLAQHALAGTRGPVPLLRVDARRRRDVRALLLALAAMLEVGGRFAPRATEHSSA